MSGNIIKYQMISCNIIAFTCEVTGVTLTFTAHDIVCERTPPMAGSRYGFSEAVHNAPVIALN